MSSLLNDTTLRSVPSTGVATPTQVTSSLAGGRQIIATRLGGTYAYPGPTSSSGLFFTNVSSKMKHTVLVGAADIRLIYGTTIQLGFTSRIKVGLEFGGVIYPVTFSGKAIGQWDAGGYVISDPIPISVVAGDIFYTRAWNAQTFGANVQLTTAAVVGDSTLTIGALPQDTGPVVVDNNPNATGNAEQVIITGYSGSGPYTATLHPSTLVTKAHAINAYVGQPGMANTALFTDKGDFIFKTGDNAYSGTFTALGTGTSTTLSASTNISDAFFTTAAVFPSGTVTIDTAGNAETVTVTQITGTAGPWKAWVHPSTPLTKAHSSGVTVSPANKQGDGLAPIAIVADRVSATPPKTSIVVGDSITFGTQINGRNATSYASLAFASAKAFINGGLASEEGNGFNNTANQGSTRRILYDLCGWVVWQYGTNDIVQNKTLTQLQGYVTTAAAEVHRRGVKFAVCTVLPRTTSTDLWFTTGNQTVIGTESVRTSYNTWVRAGAGGLADMVIDIAAQAETSLNSGIWKVNQPSGPCTSDGVHPSESGATLIATAFDMSLFV